MREKCNNSYWLLRLALMFSAVSSLAVLAVPLLDIEKRVGITKPVVIPLIFWLGLIFEQIALHKLRKTVRGSFKKEKTKKREFPGVIAFFKTKEGKNADIVLIVSLVLLIMFTVIQKSESVIQYILVFTVILSFRLHAIFNGRSYKLLKKGYKSENITRKESEKNGE